jgi:hypothetical protein
MKCAKYRAATREPQWLLRLKKKGRFAPMAMLWRTGTAITKEMGAGW